MKGIPMKKKKKKRADEVAKDCLEKTSKNETIGQEKTLEKTKDLDTIALPEENDILYTKAELSFLKMQAKIRSERALQKASKSHRQRVEEFNRKLDEMTEHYDIPKVSWTK